MPKSRRIANPGTKICIGDIRQVQGCDESCRLSSSQDYFSEHKIDEECFDK